MSWRVAHHLEPAGTFHAREVPATPERAAWVCAATAPALVLGSAQHDDRVDRAACAAAGIEVVRRRSGGGAVLVVPGEVLWVDLIVPAGDALWQDDVGRAFHWVGEAWAAALEELGVAAEVHRGALVRSPWSAAVCFAGLGPGEVTVAGRKVVGISQRRTRAGRGSSAPPSAVGTPRRSCRSSVCRRPRSTICRTWRPPSASTSSRS